MIETVVGQIPINQNSTTAESVHIELPLASFKDDESEINGGRQLNVIQDVIIEEEDTADES